MPIISKLPQSHGLQTINKNKENSSTHGSVLDRYTPQKSQYMRDERGAVGYQGHPTHHLGQSGSIKYLRPAQLAQSNSFSQSTAANTAPKAAAPQQHSSVLLKAQNLQNRNDSFGAMQSRMATTYAPGSYARHEQQPSAHGPLSHKPACLTNMYRPVVNSHQVTSPQPTASTSNLRGLSPSRGDKLIHSSPQRDSHPRDAHYTQRSSSHHGTVSTPSSKRNEGGAHETIAQFQQRLSSTGKGSFTPTHSGGNIHSSDLARYKQGFNPNPVGGVGGAPRQTDFSNVSHFSITGKKAY